MADYLMESFYDLLVGDFETIFDSDSRRRCHHPSRKCFMANTFAGHVESFHEQEVTPLPDLYNEVEGDARVPPRLQAMFS
jgi:hypothetical protein